MAQPAGASYKRRMTDYGSARRLARAGAAGTLATAGMFVLAACATPQAPAQIAPPVQQMASLPPPAPPALEAIPEPPPAPEPPAEMLPPLAPEPPPPPPMPTDAQSLRAAYGAPAFIRREPDSELWRYDGMNCAAFFFLYPDEGTYRIRYAETTPRGRDMPADPDCLRSLIVPGAGAPASGPML